MLAPLYSHSAVAFWPAGGMRPVPEPGTPRGEHKQHFKFVLFKFSPLLCLTHPDIDADRGALASRVHDTIEAWLVVHQTDHVWACKRSYHTSEDRG